MKTRLTILTAVTLAMLLPTVARGQTPANAPAEPMAATGPGADAFYLCYRLQGVVLQDDALLRDAILDSLRGLYKAHRNDRAVRERFAEGLFLTLFSARREGNLPRRDALLAELRRLYEAHTDNAAIAKWLTKGLFYTRIAAKGEGDAERRDALMHELNGMLAADGGATLDELRALQAIHRNDPDASDLLAMGLAKAVGVGLTAGDLAARDAGLAELRELYKEHGHEQPVRKALAVSLFNTIAFTFVSQDFDLRDSACEELRAIYEARPNDPVVRSLYVRGMGRQFLARSSDPDLAATIDVMLKGMRTLYWAHTDDPVVRMGMARAMLTGAGHAIGHLDNPMRADRLLDELRSLVRRHPGDAAFRYSLVNCLTHMIFKASRDEKEPLIDEMRELHTRFPDDVDVRAHLAESLNGPPHRDKGWGDPTSRNARFAELRGLCVGPEDTIPLRRLAASFRYVHSYALKEGDTALRDEMLDEMRALYQEQPDHRDVRTGLAFALHDTFVAADAEEVARLDALLKEVRNLSHAHIEDEYVRKHLAWTLWYAFFRAVEVDDRDKAESVLLELRALEAKYTKEWAMVGLRSRLWELNDWEK